MCKNNYIVRYGSNNAIRSDKLDLYLKMNNINIKNKNEYFDYAAKYAVSNYYHNRISEANSFIGLGVGASSIWSDRETSIWLFNHPTTDIWMKQSKNGHVNSKDIYQFPTSIWITKDIRQSN